MLLRLKLPKTLLWTANLFAGLLLFFSLFRLITFFAFKPPGISFSDSVPSFLMGLQYDLKWIAIVLLPILVFSIQPAFTPFFSSRNRRFWTWYLAIVFFILFFFFIADLVSFSYNRTRLDAGAMNFVEDPGISLGMMWQTYPLIWITVGLLLAIVVFKWLLTRSYFKVNHLADGKAIQHRKLPFIISVCILLLFIYGKIDSKPLKWKDSFALKDSFKTYLALNPLQNFFSTMRLRQPVFNEARARGVFPIMVDFLQLPTKQPFGFKRHAEPRSGALESRPNVVLVMCESFSMYKSTMSGNPLNTTPYFDSMARQGIFFERCFSPHFSTARGLFAILTGTPDVQLFKFSTRNPAAINQHTIINDFTQYSKHYFLGGNPEFNNFEGLLDNIDNLQKHTEKGFAAPKVNVWGISDKDLFLAAHAVFTKEKQPFFAIIQTSGNHRPYTIPEEDRDFEIKEPDKNELAKYGFGSVEEYNSFRYSDYCFKKFMEAAQQAPYFHNTIFVFVGDHGVAGNASSVYPPAWTDQRLTDEHVPLLFFAPRLIQPQRRTEVVSQIDVLPTIAGFINMPYNNSSLGRDLLDPKKKNDIAFITNTAGKIGIVSNEFYYIRSLEFDEEVLVPVISKPANYSQVQSDSIQKQMAELTNAYYQTALYLIMNNKK